MIKLVFHESRDLLQQSFLEVYHYSQIVWNCTRLRLVQGSGKLWERLLSKFAKQLLYQPKSHSNQLSSQQALRLDNMVNLKH